MKFDQIELHHLKKAADDFDKGGMPPTFGAASFYDAVFEGKTYPPKALIALAQQRATGILPKSSEFAGGEKTACFKTLEKLGVTIQPKSEVSMHELLCQFALQAQTSSLKSKAYNVKYEGFNVKGSFGQGTPAMIPWLSIHDEFLKEQRGINCVYLYYKDQGVIFLSLGVMEKVDRALWAWPDFVFQEYQTIEDYFASNYSQAPFRYGESMVFRTYRPRFNGGSVTFCDENKTVLSPSQIEDDIQQALEVYRTAASLIKGKGNPEFLAFYLSRYRDLITPSKEFDPFKQKRKHDELYKWQAFQCFKDNWNDDHDAENIATILKNSFKKVGNLGVSGNYYPIQVLSECAEYAPEEVSTMFHSLYDESQPFEVRIKQFMSGFDVLKDNREESFGSPNSSHFQDKRAIALYLSFRYPEKYFLYKSTMISGFCSLTGFWDSKEFPRGAQNMTSVKSYFEMCEELRQILLDQPDIMSAHQARLQSLDFNPTFNDQNLLTQDFIYSIEEYLAPDHKDEKLLVDLMTKAGYEDVLSFLELLKKLFSDLEIQEFDQRLSWSLPQSDKNFMGITIGRQRAVGINLKGSEKSFTLLDNAVNGKAQQRGAWRRLTSMDELERSYADLLTNSKAELEVTELTGHLDSSSLALSKLYWDPEYRKMLFKKAFNRDLHDKHAPFPSQQKRDMNTADLNQIFFGPPGTGKTFNTINAALEIVDPEFLETHKDDRAALVRRFKELQLTESNPDGQIAFTTFHQSLSYEDFIEGIKPDINNTDESSLAYRIEDGIFKRLCNVAENNNFDDPQEKREPIISSDQFSSGNFWKMSLGESGDDIEAEIYDYCINHNFIATGWGSGVDCTGLNRDEIDVKFEGMAKFHAMAMKRFAVRMKVGDFVLISNGNKSIRALGEIIGDYEYHGESPLINHDGYNHFRQVRWLFHSSDVPVKLAYRKQFMMQSIYGLDKGALKQSFFVGGNSEPSVSKQYALVIDEINRGNVSSIFGELITLIEKDKRQGQENELQATLPYSKESFSVPSNVYIIGTMNTADRSVEALDSALRRRFSFKEMPPQPELIRSVGKLKASNGCLPDGTDLCKILEAINSRLLVLLDKDHLIGHSYFLSATNEEDLKTLFEDKVLPLLEEYFFGDYGKIGLVLGKSFVAKTSRNTQLLGEGYDVLREDLGHREDFELQEKEDWNFKAIYKQ